MHLLILRESVTKTLLTAVLFAISYGANADLYKCKDATGKIEYKSRPCIITTKTLMSIEGDHVKWFDDEGTQTTVKQNDAQANGLPADVDTFSRKNLEIAKSRCVPDGCSPIEWRNVLSGVSTTSVVWLLGPPRVQLVGGTETHYYSVKLDHGTGTLQLLIKKNAVSAVNVY